MPKSHYEQRIIEDAARMGFIGANPRWIEAWMRSEHSTLDFLDPARFKQNVAIAITCVMATSDEENEKLAASYGLGARPEPEWKHNTWNKPDMGAWTKHTSTCARCHRRFRISEVALQSARDNAEPGETDEQIAQTLDFCLGCVDGNSPEGEYDVPLGPNDPSEIPGLTVMDVLAIAAALDVAASDDEEPFPGILAANEKVAPIAEALRSRIGRETILSVKEG